MSSTSRRQILSKRLRSTKARFAAFMVLVLVAAVFSANAVTASNDQTLAGQLFSFIGISASSQSGQDDKSGVLPQQDDAVKAARDSGCDTAPAGLIACYKGDNDTADVRGVHNGEWVDGFGYAAGKVGAGAFSFDGKSRVVVPNSPDLNPANLTVDGWVNLSSKNAEFQLIGKGDAYSLMVRHGVVTFASRNAAGEVETLDGSGRGLKAQDWVHVAATHDGAMRRLYINGEEVASAAQEGLFVADENDLVIGRTVTNEGYFAGLADEVKLFNRALTEKEIKDLFEGSKPDAAITFTDGNAQVVDEGDAGQTNLSIDFTRAAGGGAGNMTVSITPISATQGATNVCGVGDDYVVQPNPVTITWVANQQTASFGVGICGDTIPEGQEQFLITIVTVPAGDSGAGSTQTVSINDNDLTVSVSGVTNSPVLEDSATRLLYTFDRTPDAPNNNFVTRVFFTTNGSTASDSGAGDDFDIDPAAGSCLNEFYDDASNAGFADIPAGASSCTLAVDALNDVRVEPNETVVINLSNNPGSYVNLAPLSQTGTITNDDFAVVDFGVDPGTDDEGNPGAAGNFVFDFDRVVPAGSQTEALTVTFTLGGSANGGAGCVGNGAPVDYTVVTPGTNNATFDPATCTGTVTFAAGVDSASVAINVVPDTIVEPDETIVGTIIPGPQSTNANRYTIGADVTDTATINDDDENVTVTVANSPLSEAGPGSIQFNLTRVFNSTPNPLFAATPSSDALVVSFSLAGTASGTATPAQICTNDGIVDYTVTGDGTHAVTFNPATCTGTVAFAAAAIPGFTADDLTATVNVTPINDTRAEQNETVIFTVLPGTVAPNIYGAGNPNANPAGTNTATGIILNDDCIVTVTGATPPSVLENGGNMTFNFQRVGEGCGPTTVNFNLSGSATPGTDYTVIGANSFNAGTGQGTIIIPAGAGNPATVGGVQANQATLTIDPTDDNIVENNEEVQIQVDNGPGYTPGTPAQASGIIVDNDNIQVTVAAIDATAVEGTTANTDTLTYRFTRTDNGPSACAVSCPALQVVYDINTINPPANPADAADFQHPPNMGNNVIVIPANTLFVDLVVVPVPDALVEPDEIVRVTVQSAGGYVAGIPSFADGTIVNDDTTIVCTGPTPAQVLEGTPPGAGNNMTFTCTRTSGGAIGAGPFAIPFTLGGTATFGADYTVGGNTTGNTAAGGVLNFNAGSNTASVVITTVPEALIEPDETVTVTFASGGAGVNSFVLIPTPTTLTGTILNDDQSVGVAIVGGGSVLENSANSIRFDFTRDFGALPNNLSGTVTANFTINVGNNAPEATTPGATGVTNADCNGSQGGGNLFANDFTLSAFSDQGTNAVATGFTFNAATCTGTITFPANDNVVSLIVTPTNDSVVEPNENVVVAVATASGGNVYTPTGAAQTGVILNDDTAFAVNVICPPNTNVPVFPAAGSTIQCGGVPVVNGVLGGGNAEGDTNTLTDNSLTPHGSTAVFTVTRTGNTTGTQLIDISTIPTGTVGSGTATSGAPNTPCGAPGVDYITDGETLTFLDGETTKFFYVAVCGDTQVEADETIVAQLTNPQPNPLNPAGGSINIPTGTATWIIYNDDGTTGLFFRATNATATEGNPVNFQVCVYTTATGTTLAAGSNIATDLTFDFTTVPNTATAADFTPLTGTTTILAGTNCSPVIAVDTLVDGVFEGTETFFFDVTNTTPGTGLGGTIVIPPGTNPAANGATPTNPNATTNRAVGSITDVDTPGVFTIRDVRQAEGNQGDNATTFNFPLTFTGGGLPAAGQTICWVTRSGDITIANPPGGANPATPGLSATGSADYTGIGELAGQVPNCFTFPGGTLAGTTVNIPVVINGDLVPEPDETFSVVLGTVTGGVFTPLPACPAAGSPTTNCVATNPDHPGNVNYNGVGIGTIQNDDAAVSVGIVSIGGTVGGVTNAVLETDVNTFNIPVTFSLSGPVQTANNTVTITYTVTPTGTNPATVGAAGGTPTGNNPAGACSGTIDLYPPTTTGAAPTATSVTTSFTTTVNTVINLVGCGDLRPERNETFLVSITGVTGGPVFVAGTTTGNNGCQTSTTALCGTKIGTIVDNDQLGPFFFLGPDNGDVSKAEGPPPTGTNPFDFNFTYGGVAAEYPIVVTLQTVDGTATSPSDYTPRTTANGNPCTVTFAANSQTGTPSPSCTVNVIPDFVQEGDESFTVQVTGFDTGVVSGGFAVLGNNAQGNPVVFNPATYGTNLNPAPVGTDLIAQGNILNDDGNNVFSVSNVTQLEGNAGTTNFVFRVERQGSSNLTSQVAFTVVPFNSGTAGTAPAVVGNTANGLTTCGTANQFPTTNNQGVALSGVDVLDPGSQAVNPNAGNTSVNGNVITFNPNLPAGAGNEFVDIIVQVCGDTRTELNDQFRVQLTGVSNASVANQGGIGTITNDDFLTFTVVQANPLTINEGNNPGNANTSNATLTITATGTTNITPSIAITYGGTATGGANCSDTPTAASPDYRNTVTSVPVSGTGGLFNFPGTANANTSGTIQGSAQIQIPICGDTVLEPDETIILTFTGTNISSAATGTATTSNTIIILNDDAGAPAAGFEGDIFTRPNGDGNVDQQDLFQFDRFNRLLDCPQDTAANNEFQRLDYNDNGFIDGGDYTAIFNVVLGLAPKVPAKGPTARPAGLCTPIAGEEGDGGDAAKPEAIGDVRLIPVYGPAGSQVTVWMEIQTDGNVRSTGGSISFDPTILSINNTSGINNNPSVINGPGAVACQNRGVNATNVANGQLGYLIDFTCGQGNTPLPAGTRQVVGFVFNINPAATVGQVSPVNFIANGPTPQQTVTVTGATINLNYINGSATVTGARTLTIGTSNTTFQKPALVPVTAVYPGGELSTSFTIQWDPALASFSGNAADVTFGANTAQCTVRNLTTAQTAQGRLGVTITGCNTPITSGTVATIRLTPTAAATPGTTIPLTFQNVPTGSVVGDAAGAPLATTFVPGAIIVLGTTAAEVTVSGRVYAPNGAPLRNAIVTITDSEGNTRSTVTTTFGTYSFENVESGMTYVVRVSSKRYRFTARPVALTDNVADFDFTATGESN